MDYDIFFVEHFQVEFKVKIFPYIFIVWINDQSYSQKFNFLKKKKTPSIKLLSNLKIVLKKKEKKRKEKVFYF